MNRPAFALLLAVISMTPAGHLFAADTQQNKTDPSGINDSSEVPQKRASPINISGIYPHLTMRNREGECGTGAVVLWQGDLWAVTYAPHRPAGSSDKLYQITPNLEQKIFNGSVGGTPANRMVHRESNQLLIGPYVIDSKKKIRVIPPSAMYGRLTGNARHLTDPTNKVYYATMEEGLYEVDVNSLAVNCLIRDGNGGAPKTGVVSKLLGYHGKGLYSGQGRVVYSNNGERDPRVKVDPTVPSGALATWQGDGDWQLVRRNQFTEVTGPDGIYGSSRPESSPVWAMGWDARSLILALLENEEWHFYRLPKGSHSYDGAHGWNTEWPRIREIGEDDMLATMHGTFWRFPKQFSKQNSGGISPRSNYLKVIGDFCHWNDRIVFGCDDSAASEFLNTRAFKSKHASPGQSNSNLWFVKPAKLDQLGPVVGRGSVWLREDVSANTPSDPYLFSGYDYRQLHLTHNTDKAVVFRIEIDRMGKDSWTPLRKVTVPANESVSLLFDSQESGSWIRVSTMQDANDVTAHLQFRNRDRRSNENAPMFSGIATPGQLNKSYGLMRSLSYDRLGLAAADNPAGNDATYYELNQQMQLVPKKDQSATSLISAVAQPRAGVTVDAASVIVVEDGKRFRLPKSPLRTTQPNERDTAEPTAYDQLEDHIGKHLAIGAKVKVSSTHADYVASNAIDGKLSDESRWIGMRDSESWIELDLGKPQMIASVWVITGWQDSSQYAADNYKVQIKRDNKWQTIPGGAVRNNNQVRRELIFDEPISTQHLRLVSDTNDYFRIYEIAPFAKRLNVQRRAAGFTTPRICREVATERDLLNLHGTFYELPARNAQGLAKIRPVATHNLAIHDFCSHNGLLLFTGVDADTKSEHIIRSADGKAALWAGVVDDLWQLGKPRGIGGPWQDTAVTPDTPSDPFLMTAYDKKNVTISTTDVATIRLEVDVDGTGLWIPYRSFTPKPGHKIEHEFAEGFSAYWIRAVSDKKTTATVTFVYN